MRGDPSANHLPLEPDPGDFDEPPDDDFDPDAFDRWDPFDDDEAEPADGDFWLDPEEMDE